MARELQADSVKDVMLGCTTVILVNYVADAKRKTPGMLLDLVSNVKKES